jgi:hypothetical protein
MSVAASICDDDYVDIGVYITVAAAAVFFC